MKLVFASLVVAAAASVDCSKATCQSECECANKQCADPINKCLADATCAKGQSCAMACACGDTACSLKCAAQAGFPLALPVATCVNSKCSSVEETAVDCSKATCQSECECANKQCADPINKCLADATCAKGQSCAMACACGDTACSLKCAAQAGSPLALPVATCVNSKCSSLEATGGTLAITFTDCGDSSTHGVCKDIEPKSLTLGQDTDITGSGTVDEDVSGGSFEMKLNAAGIISEDWKGDVCTAASFDVKALGIKVGTVSWKGLACPLKAGAASVPLSVSLSSALPAAISTSTLALTAKDTSGANLLCVNIDLKKQQMVEETAVDCSKATCQSECECANKQCADPINKCLADATCAKGQSCAMACACGDTACSLKCAAQAGSPLALPVATCINSKCSSVEETAVDCSKATCQSECECANKQCTDPINKCLADATCAKGQSCAMACACGDTACSLKCAAQAGSPLALPVATCINSKCSSLEATGGPADCSKATCKSDCECANKECADPITKCLADATCAKGQSCAMACACGDKACGLKCAAQAGSPLALPVATCINSKCASMVLV